mgnify:CR=1 FL=1
MNELREAIVTSAVCKNRHMLHGYLHDALGFPDYYGHNLSALADCLAEAGTPLLVTFAIDAESLPTDMQAYMLKLVQVCAREALANENVSLIVEHGLS